MRSRDENWYLEQQRIARIKDGVRDLHARGVKLGYEWDAGGDDTLCWPVTTPEYEIAEELRGELYDAIVGKLELPNAGEHYIKGKGELFIRDEDDALVMRFSQEESWYYEGDEVPAVRTREEISMEDPSGFRKFIPRGDVRLEFGMDWKGRETFNILFDPKEGDAPEMDYTGRAYYISVLRPYAELYTKFFGPRENGFVGGKVTVYCALRADGKALVSVLDDLRLVKEYIDDEVILIP